METAFCQCIYARRECLLSDAPEDFDGNEMLLNIRTIWEFSFSYQVQWAEQEMNQLRRAWILYVFLEFGL